MKKILKYIILTLFILNFPGFIYENYDIGYSSVLSYISFFLLVLYYFLYLKGKPNIWLLYVGLGYFLISGLNMYVHLPLSNYIIMIAKYLILVIFGNSFFKSVTKNEILVFLLIGASTIIINAIFFSNNYGRYGGFYLNPNAGGFICMIGYVLNYSIPNKRIRIFCQILFTVAGLLTFSRTFILVWVLINLLSVFINIKNIKVLGIGFLLGILLLTFGELLNLEGIRFKQYQNVFNNKSSARSLKEGGRTETWALFYEDIYNNPFVGGGYGKFQGNGIFNLGPHNTYMLIILEAGIIPLLVFITFMFYLLIWSNKLFALDPTLFLMCIVLAVYLLTNHNYFNSYILLCATVFIHQKIEQLKEKDSLLKIIDKTSHYT